MIGQRTPQSVRNPPARLTAPLSTAARRAEAQRPKTCPQPATSMANRHGRGSAMKARRQPSLAQTTLLTRRLSPQPSPAQSPKSPPAPRMACAPILLPSPLARRTTPIPRQKASRPPANTSGTTALLPPSRPAPQRVSRPIPARSAARQRPKNSMRWGTTTRQNAPSRPARRTVRKKRSAPVAAMCGSAESCLQPATATAGTRVPAEPSARTAARFWMKAGTRARSFRRTPERPTRISRSRT